MLLKWSLWPCVRAVHLQTETVYLPADTDWARYRITTFIKTKTSCQFVMLYYYYYNRFMVLCPGLRRWAGTRRNIHPLTYPDRHPTLISFFHILWSILSFLINLRAWQSFCTTSVSTRLAQMSQKQIFVLLEHVFDITACHSCHAINVAKTLKGYYL